MLLEFLDRHRDRLVESCRQKSAARNPPSEDLDGAAGIPLFFDQLVETLRIEQGAHPMQSRAVSGSDNGQSESGEIGADAARHGHSLFKRGFAVGDVIHCYGDLCQSVTNLASDTGMEISADEWRTFNRCLDNAMAAAVQEFSYQRQEARDDTERAAFNTRLGFLAHELRNYLASAKLALAAVKMGSVGLSGATGTVLERSLDGATKLIDRTLDEVRILAAMPARNDLISVDDFVRTAKIYGALDADHRQCRFVVSDVDPELAVRADFDTLFSAVTNLLQNAFKFTRPGTEVSLSAHASGNRILIDVADMGGGVDPKELEQWFAPFQQTGADRSGLGLGLTIAQRAVQAHDGVLSARNNPGVGCTFTIDLPRHNIQRAADAQARTGAGAKSAPIHETRADASMGSSPG